jgi:hypothetical protein
MIEPTSDARRYRIIIRGECGRLLVSLIENVEVEPAQDGNTRVVALVRDDPELWGLMEQLRDLALHVVSLQELDHGQAEALTVWHFQLPAGWGPSRTRAQPELLHLPAHVTRPPGTQTCRSMPPAQPVRQNPWPRVRVRAAAQ